MRISFRKKLIMLILLSVLIPSSVINVLLSLYVSKLVKTELRSFGSDMFDQAAQNIEFLAVQLDNQKKLLISKIISSGLMEYASPVESLEAMNSYNETAGLMRLMKAASSIDMELLFINSDGLFVSTLVNPERELFEKQEFLESLRTGPSGAIKTKTQTIRYRDRSLRNQEQKVLSLAVQFHSTSDPAKTGIVQIDVNERFLKEFFGNFSRKNTPQVVLVSGQDEIFASLHDPDVGQDISHCGLKRSAQGTLVPLEPLSPDLLFFEKAVPGSDWRLAVTMSTSGLTSSITRIRDASILIAVVIVIISALISYFLVRKLTYSLKVVMDSIDAIGMGDLSNRVPILASPDIQLLAKSVNSMADRIGQLMENVALAEKECTRAEFRSLQSKINPHFLFNTLQTLSGIAKHNNDLEAVEITASLARLFRYSINADDRVGTLGGEVEQLEDYVSIQKKRFGNVFDFVRKIPADLESVLLPRLLLQPIVENAFVHGIEGIGRFGLITVSAAISGSVLGITVSDNGAGIDPERLGRIRSLLHAEKIQYSAGSDGNDFGIGIMNVHNRIRLAYGDKFGLSVDSTVGEGTHVSIIVPCNPEK